MSSYCTPGQAVVGFYSRYVTLVGNSWKWRLRRFCPEFCASLHTLAYLLGCAPPPCLEAVSLIRLPESPHEGENGGLCRSASVLFQIVADKTEYCRPK